MSSPAAGSLSVPFPCLGPRRVGLLVVSLSLTSRLWLLVVLKRRRGGLLDALGFDAGCGVVRRLAVRVARSAIEKGPVQRQWSTWRNLKG